MRENEFGTLIHCTANLTYNIVNDSDIVVRTYHLS